MPSKKFTSKDFSALTMVNEYMCKLTAAVKAANRANRKLALSTWKTMAADLDVSASKLIRAITDFHNQVVATIVNEAIAADNPANSLERELADVIDVIYDSRTANKVPELGENKYARKIVCACIFAKGSPAGTATLLKEAAYIELQPDQIVKIVRDYVSAFGKPSTTGRVNSFHTEQDYVTATAVQNVKTIFQEYMHSN